MAKETVNIDRELRDKVTQQINENVDEWLKSFMIEWENRRSNLVVNYRNSIVTFLWFVIAASSVLIAYDSTPRIVKILFLFSILCLAVSLTAYIYCEQYEVQKFWDYVSGVCKIEFNGDKDELTKQVKELDKVLVKKTTQEKIKENLFDIFLRVWILLFVIWLARFAILMII